MKDYKTDLCDKLTALVMASQGTNPGILKLKIMQVLNDYQISEACTELVEWHGDRNAALIQRWIISKAVAGCTDRTIKYYRASVERILMRIGKDIDQIAAPDVQVYFAQEIARGTSLTTVDNDKRVLSSMYNYLYREEIIRNNPMLRIDPIRREKKKKPAFSDMDIERIRAACRTNREKMIVEVLLSTACRVSEFVSIKYGDIQDGKLTIIGKGKKARVVYFNAKAILAMEQYMEERKDSNPYLLPKGIHISEWPKELRNKKSSGMWYANPNLIDSGHQDNSSIESIIRDIGKRAGVENAHPHRFRRTCATNALRKGMPIEMVSKMLGHENIATTQIYLDLSEDDLKMMHEKFVT